MKTNPSSGCLSSSRKTSSIRRWKVKLLAGFFVFGLAPAAQAAVITVDTDVQCGGGAAPEPVDCCNYPVATGDGVAGCSMGEAFCAAISQADFGPCVGVGAYGVSDTIVLPAGGVFKFTQVDNSAVGTDKDTGECLSNGPNALPVVRGGTITVQGNGSTLQRIGSSEGPFMRLAEVDPSFARLSLNGLSVENFFPGCDAPGPRCGDGTLQPDNCENGPCEQCDDGNAIEKDGCNNSCQLTACGDGNIDSGEQCDDGGVCLNTTIRCDPSAPANLCPQGSPCVQQDNDGCFNCHFEVGPDFELCGNGVLDPGEVCDGGGRCVDPNGNVTETPCDSNADCGSPTAGFTCQPQSNDGDNCSSTCQLEGCGNGRVEPGEECDPGGICVNASPDLEGKNCVSLADCCEGALCGRDTDCVPQKSNDGCDDQCRRETCENCHCGGAVLVGDIGFLQGGGGGGEPPIFSGLELDACTLKANLVETSPPPDFDDSAFGGAVCAGGNSEVIATDTSFVSNEASFGGAVFLSPLAHLHADRTTFEGNLASQLITQDLDSPFQSLGGAVVSFFGDIEIDQSALFQNEAFGWGGGLAFLCADGVVQNTTLFDNAANLGGGAFSLWDQILCFELAQQIFCGEDPQTGEPRCDEGFQLILDILGVLNPNDVRFQSSTITQNRAAVTGATGDMGEGGGLWVSGGDVSLRDTILAGNTSDVSGPDCNGPLDSADFNLFGTADGCAVAFETNDIYPAGLSPVLDPELKACDPSDSSPGSQFCAPECTSPALDQGSLDGSADDQIGTLRYFLDGTRDIGAIETNCAACGNGVVEPPFESCDEGGICDNGITPCTSDYDCNLVLAKFCLPVRHPGCSEQCILESCGNGLLDKDEECDDGQHCLDGPKKGASCISVSDCFDATNNEEHACVRRNGDGCNSACLNEYCGDSVVNDATICPPNTDCLPLSPEECDDGNTIPDDRCDNCKLTKCGDDVVQVAAGEECEPNLPSSIPSGMVCSAFCELEPIGGGGGGPNCGNNALDPGEECDDGFSCADGSDCDDDTSCDGQDGSVCARRSGDGCDNNCSLPRCGNGIVAVDESGNVEQCDDGNNIGGDGCSPTCVREECGNGVMDPGEQCDDGNTLDDDGCGATCRFEFCGDEVTNLDCLSEDACASTCNCEGVSNGFIACFSRTIHEQVCTGGVDEDEDGLTDCADLEDCGCTPPCSAGCLVQLPPSETALCNGDPACIELACSDCVSIDTGNPAVDCADPDCADATVCNTPPPPIAGSEECDDGNTDNHDLCTDECRSAVCGDGHVQGVAGEQCDDGGLCNSVAGFPCAIAADCQSQDTCDDTNHCAVTGGDCSTDADCTEPLTCVLQNGDGCNNLCQVEHCGDGTLDPDGRDNILHNADDEECDDANNNMGDGCTSTCKTEFCGDGLASAVLSEDCDNGGVCVDGPAATNGNPCTSSAACSSFGACVTVGGLSACAGGENDGNSCDNDADCPPDLGSCEHVDSPDCTDCDDPLCGNGTVEAGEECDQGAGNSSAPNAICRPGCVKPRCGDGIKDDASSPLPEQCDDGNQSDGDGCSDDCQIELPPPFCGDGNPDLADGEQCDDGNTNPFDDCTNFCTWATCGDNILHISNNTPALPNGQANGIEDCDDGNRDDHDLCTSLCESAVCGDGFVLSGGEDCDDGNTVNGDGCNQFCEPEGCGDGFPDPDGPDNDPSTIGDNERCDDGNLVPGDGCNGACDREFCGDGIVTVLLGEECDNFGTCVGGAGTDGDDCQSPINCLGSEGTCPAGTCVGGSEPGTGCASDDECDDIPDGTCEHNDTPDCTDCKEPDGGGETNPLCDHDGEVDLGEECDDGLTCPDGVPCASAADCSHLCPPLVDCTLPDGICAFHNNDGCSNECQVEYCGDGIPQFLMGEECDDGNFFNGDGCNADCLLETCGNDILDKHEECDDGQHCVSTDEAFDGLACLSVDDCGGAPCLRRNGDGCNEHCRAESCGDGFWDADGPDAPDGANAPDDDEECDDGNNIPGDGCHECLLESCGDGVVQPSEECDDGLTDPLPLEDGDGCSKFCREERCGDGVKQDPEECDDGNQADNDGCSDTCEAESCGDNVKQPSEQCEDGNTVNNDGCSEFCQVERCGDGVKQTGEDCDDGNQADGDGCSDTCETETPPDCGDGNTDPGEECDDSNILNGDGCNHDCEVEFCGDGFFDPNGGDNAPGGGDDEQCEPPNGITCDADCQLIPETLPVCGDGNHDPGEQCDDGNAVNDDECTDLCTLPRCGDGIPQDGEECDDGNANAQDSCTNACKFAECGDGIVLTDGEETEDCDDGDTNDLDECRNDCTNPRCGDGEISIYAGEECDPEDGVDYETLYGLNCVNCELESGGGDVPPFCGDGNVDSGEDCDDGNAIPTDACNACRNPECGDNAAQSGEECDDGNGTDTDACTNACENAECGDGIVRSGVEQCDDGNTVNGDGCDSGCMDEPTEPAGDLCGNEIEDPGEECDDGAANSDTVPNACRTTCKDASCGDGVVDSGEECDKNRDDCNLSCKIDACAQIEKDAAEVNTNEELVDFIDKYKVDIDLETLRGTGRSTLPQFEDCALLFTCSGTCTEDSVKITPAGEEALSSGCSLIRGGR